MSYVKLNNKPFEHSFNTLIESVFSELPLVLKNDFNNSERKGNTPVNVQENKSSFELEVIAPGFEKTDFKIGVENNLLTITGELKTDDSKLKDSKQIRREYTYQSFKRTFTIDESIDATNIEAIYVNGILRLNLPKKVEVKQKVNEIVIK